MYGKARWISAASGSERGLTGSALATARGTDPYQRPETSNQVPRLPRFAPEQFRRRGVIDEIFSGGVPNEFSLRFVRDVADVGNGCRAVADLDVGVRRFTRANAFDEVGGVQVGGVLRLRPLRFHPIAYDGPVSFARGARGPRRLRVDLEADAVGEERAVRAVIRLAVRAVVFAAHLVIAHLRRAPPEAMRVQITGLVAENEARVFISHLQNVRHLAGVFQREPAARGADAAGGLDAHHLMHGVEAVRAEIGERASCVIPEPAERPEESGAVERDFRRRAEIEIPIEAFGRRPVGRSPYAVGRQVAIVPYAHEAHFA